MPLAVRPPLPPMLARLERELPRGGWLSEPKWHGFRCLAFRDGGEVDLRSRNQRPLARCFPEWSRPSSLLARLHPAASRVERLRRETPAALGAFDLLALGEEDLRDLPFRERRERLEALLAQRRRRGSTARRARGSTASSRSGRTSATSPAGARW